MRSLRSACAQLCALDVGSALTGHQLALDGFTRSRELVANEPRASILILFNIARAQEELGRYRDALEGFERYLLTPESSGTGLVNLPGIEPLFFIPDLSMRGAHGAVLGDDPVGFRNDVILQRIGCRP